DGYLSFGSDGAGGTRVYYDPDGHGTANPWPFLVTTLDGVAPAGLTAAALTTAGGSVPTTPAAPAGVVLTAANDSGSVLIGGAGADTFNASQGADTLTGGAGADTFTFAHLPWNAGHITDFTVGVDHLNLKALFVAAGYSGANPIADGVLSFRADGAGSTQVYFDPDGAGTGSPWPFLITTLDHVAPGALTAADWDFR
ncbi:MAG: exsH, partial [Caulobacter sp.]|nr:exsH [Caulobacter sp.]